MKYILIVLTAIVLLAGCGKQEPPSKATEIKSSAEVFAEDASPKEEVSLGLPCDPPHIQKIEGFSNIPDCPWARINHGFDFFTDKDLVPFYAPVKGELLGTTCINDRSKGSQTIELTFKYNNSIFWVYSFEIFSPLLQDRQIQLNNIALKPGDKVKKGDLVGALHRANDFSRVHLAIRKDGRWSSPEKYFSKEIILHLREILLRNYPAAELSYQ